MPVSAKRSCPAAARKLPTMTPPRRNRPGCARGSRPVMAKTTINESIAPVVAQTGIIPDRPGIATATAAPRDAPLATPRRYGSASGFPVRPCRDDPADASAAPTSTAMTARGSRKSITIVDATLPSLDPPSSLMTSARGTFASPTSSDSKKTPLRRMTRPPVRMPGRLRTLFSSRMRTARKWHPKHAARAHRRRIVHPQGEFVQGSPPPLQGSHPVPLHETWMLLGPSG